MTDRTPTDPNRFTINRIDTGEQFDAYLTLNDLPVDPGTPLNKETLLQDATAAMIGLGTDATVNDAIRELITAMRSYVLSDQAQTTQIQSINTQLNTLSSQLNSLITYGTTELTPGTSSLSTGTLYVVYE